MLSLVSVGLLLFSAGLSSIVSVGCSIAAIVLGRKGIKKVEAGETPKSKGLAQASFWIGIAGLVLSVIATLAWIAIVVAIAVDEDTRRDFENEFDNEFDQSRSISAILVPALRLMALLDSASRPASRPLGPWPSPTTRNAYLALSSVAQWPIPT